MIRRLIILLLIVGCVCYGAVINVPADSTTIQAGINAASEGDTVLVQPGTYYENIIWPATNGIKLIGSGKDDCIIDGDSLASVIRFEDSGIIDSTTLITGFTIQNGNAQGDSDFDFSTIYTLSYGGGLYLKSSSPTLTGVTFRNNTAQYGGGMFLLFGSNPTLTNVTFSSNSADGGGGMYLRFSNNPILKNVIFIDNTAENGGGMCIIQDGDSRPTLTDVTFSGNTAGSSGGGMWLGNSSPTLTNVTFSNNTADSSGGGGMYLHSSNPTLTNMIFSNNTAGFSGGGDES